MSANYGYALDPSFKSLLAGVDVRHQDVLRRAGLPEDLLNLPNVRVSSQQFFAFSQAVHDLVDDPLFTIKLAESITAEAFSPPLFAALCSPNLTEALIRLARFKPLIAPVRLGVDTSPTGLHATFEWMESNAEAPPFLIGVEILFLVKLARMGTRHHVCATEVTTPTFPRAKEAHEAFLGCPIRRGEPLSVTFSAEDAARPFLTDNSSMWDIFEPQLRKRLSDLADSASFAARTRAVLIEDLPSGQVSIDAVAHRLTVSPRTLQRRLQDEGTSFKTVVSETRESLAQHYLAQTQLSYEEIAYLLGFQEPNSFFRAFHSWTGTTPDAIRKTHGQAV